jgi:hypothetical protein
MNIEVSLDEAKELVESKYKPVEYTSYKGQSYLDEFLNLKSFGDILNVANPIGKKAQKELSEAMCLIKRVRKLVVNVPARFRILDVCAGNALTALTSVHLFKNVEAFAFDKLPRKREWEKVRNFDYIFGDIYDSLHLDYLKNKIIDNKTIIVSSHPCGQLAREIVKLYKNSDAMALFMLPCCDGKLHRTYPDVFYTKLGHYWIWCWDLALDFGGKILVDKKVLSPKNVLVYGRKEYKNAEKKEA